MKIKTLKIFALLACISVSLASLTSCVSTKSTKNDDPYHLADMDPIYLGEVIALNKQNFFDPKPRTIDTYFYPDSSNVNFRLKDGMNKVSLIFTPIEFSSLTDSLDHYLEMYENKAFEKNHKPTRKNQFQKGKLIIRWGTTGYSRRATPSYETNYEWIEDNPYFKLKVATANDTEVDQAGSPTLNLYITPSQVQHIMDLMDEDLIMSKVKEFNDAGYSFD